MAVAVDFRVLGPVEVMAGGKMRDPGEPRQRSVLAALLVDAGQAVPTGALVDRVWGEAAPRSARSSLYAYLARLRALLREIGVPLTKDSGGYRLSADPLGVDLHRFRALIARARSASDLSGAEIIERALGLWRGDAFAGLDTPWLNAMRATLEGERFAAELEYADLMLGAGRHDEVLPRLRATSAGFPLDERVCGQLMLALYRCGRPAEALQCYQELRRTLSAELGLDPGRSIEGLHQQILRADPALAVPAVMGRAAFPITLPNPAQLPLNAADFVGRGAELAALDELAAQARDGTSVPVGMIVGPGGVGKTRLAVHWSHQVMTSFPDGQLFVDLRGYDDEEAPLGSGDVLDQFLRALGTTGPGIPAGTDERAAVYRSLVSGQRLLIVLDNARTAEQVRPLLPGAPGCCVIVTCRSKLDDLVMHEAARLVPVDVLGLNDACELLAAGAASARSDREACERIAIACDRLPLALRVAVARLVISEHMSAADLAGRLADEARRLDELSPGDRGVRATLEVSYRELPEPLARVVRAIGVVDAPEFAAWVPAAALDVPIRDAERRLEHLAATGLLRVSRPGTGPARYQLHDLVRLYARQLALATESAPARGDMLGRVLAASLALAEKGDEGLGNPFVYPIYGTAPRYRVGEDVVDAVVARPLAWFEAEHEFLTGAVIRAAADGRADYAWELTSALSQYLSTGRYRDQWLRCAETATAAAAAAGDRLGQAAMLTQLADWHGDPDLTTAIGYARHALHLLTGLDAPVPVAVGQTILAALRSEAGELADARQLSGAAMEVLRHVGPLAAWARTLCVAGVIDFRQGRLDAAEGRFTEYAGIQSRLGSVRGQAEAEYFLGAVHYERGEYAEAATLIGSAQLKASRSGDVIRTGAAGIKMGQVLARQGRFEEAMRWLERSAPLGDCGCPATRAMVLRCLSEVHAAQGRPAVAARLASEASALLAGRDMEAGGSAGLHVAASAG